ncbi:ROK family protein [Terriglobus albidus]|nr:ROK family protein [Terriglobus albidus]
MGGSHVAAMAAPLNSPFAGTSASAALDEGGSASYLFDRIEGAARVALSALTPPAVIVGIAVAMPGPFDYANGISLLQHKFAAWYGVDVRKHLAVRFGIDEENIVFLNDADAFLLGELHDSSASKAVGITLGTGIGAAFAIDGRAVPATEILPNHCDLYALPWKGSTVEEFLSTRGIMKLHKERGGHYQSVKEIAEKSGVDPIAADTMSAFGKELGLVIDTFLSPFAPDVIILGGSISRSYQTFLPGVLSVNPVLANLFRVASYFEKAALLGSIAEWLRQRG